MHLDDCPATNGALKVIPGTHCAGVMSPHDIATTARQGRAVTLEARAGDVVTMTPLLVHSSSEALQPRHRRVIHIEYAAQELPGGLAWFE